MKLWNKEGNVDQAIEAFTIGDDPIYDLVLAPYDVQGSLSHCKMLQEIGYLNDHEYHELKGGLEDILKEIENGTYKIEEGVEDIHSQVEFTLVKRLGETGKKLHLGRSRNDQIAVDLKLYYRDVLATLKSGVVEVIYLLLNKAEKTSDLLIPGYTHSQAGMVSSFGLWYSSFAESLIDDVRILNGVNTVVDQNPLGSAAGYGSSLPNDRELTTGDMGFGGLLINSIYAQASRGKAELNIAFALNNLAVTINRFASDICLYSNENYRFLKLPEELTTGSSIMPHKKNPDVMELIRAKCNQLSALPMRINMLMANMQTGYHRDYQLLKEILFPELEKVKYIFDILKFCIPKISENKGIMEDPKYKLCFTVENINEYVKEGDSFRNAYHKVKEEVNKGSFEPVSSFPNHTHIGSIGNLGLKEIKTKADNL